MRHRKINRDSGPYDNRGCGKEGASVFLVVAALLSLAQALVSARGPGDEPIEDGDDVRKGGTEDW